jgi:pectinesterase
MKTRSRMLCAFLVVLPCGGALSTPAEFDFVVAKDGSGNFKTIQEAVNACRDYAERQYFIRVRNGVYREKLVIPAWKPRITLIGDNADSTVVTYDDYSGKLNADGTKMTTFTSHTCLVAATDITVENVTFENTAGQIGQAVALHVEGDRCVFRRCRLIGNQDTHLASGSSSRQYYQDCYIEGTTDFIFGAATAVFEGCTIMSKKNSYVTAASTVQGREFGFVFLNCRLISDTVATRVYLGRPWRLYAYTAFINCDLGGHILPEGWHNWNKPEAEKTARYLEYKNTGPGANASARVGWSRQLTAEEARIITADNVLRGTDGWDPSRLTEPPK